MSAWRSSVSSIKRCLLGIALLTGMAWGQVQTVSYPKPYAFGALELNGGGGYELFSFLGGAGVNSEYRHWYWDAGAEIDTAKKVNDNTGQDSGWTQRGTVDGGFGLVKTLKSSQCPEQAGYNNWCGLLITTGLTYAKLQTQLYTKSAWYPRAGLGYDGATEWFGATKDKPFTFRFIAEYVMPGTDTVNGVQGPRFTLFMPGIHDTTRHWFFREQLAYYFFHPTQTSASGTQQLGGVNEFSVVSFGVEYRF
jgi:hypothetical protein